MSSRESINAIGLKEIHWFFVALSVKLLIDVTVVSAAVRISFRAASGSVLFSELPRCELSCSWNLLSAFSSLSSILMGLLSVVFLRPVRCKQMRARIKA
ncbi:hypothetical protein Smp_188690 [Schistosoma mansoni]|uniref:hypothetical protein n=1 Tax=Schistosoma mansoni TaxID=6183 RepID=UPI00022DC0AA|nr:hypothetical protein Smp_188690 [Schistosoma mansoni]|eukprot:XP_018649283.1 hypothetical protein Smp_188690 [Schistosoma mansoni]